MVSPISGENTFKKTHTQYLSRRSTVLASISIQLLYPVSLLSVDKLPAAYIVSEYLRFASADQQRFQCWLDKESGPMGKAIPTQFWRKEDSPQCR